ncbi:E3 ubiquitin-protein ligase bre1 [Penicillium chermesinum]|nr:E3 ubiquitin-protein ligase bre1 [Penicillium chermesinum]
MPAAESPLVSSEAGLVKMDERKRPAVDNTDSAPPSKKQATTANGGAKPHPDTDMPWKDDLERIQKDAILRQMHEYKREKSNLEARLSDAKQASEHHDAHLRAIDAWFTQLVDEVKLLLGPAQGTTQETPFKSSLQFQDVSEFEAHLRVRSKYIREVISGLEAAKAANVSPDINDLHSQLAKKLADEKVTIAKLEKTLSEKQQLEESLESASPASLTVARLERQYQSGALLQSGPEGDGKREDSSPANGGSTPIGERANELEETNNKLSAISEKQKEQLQKLEAENSRLLSQITEIKIKNSKLNDEDYAHTDLFKQLRSQYDDVVKRVNHLEATNIKLREEAEKYRAERTAYRIQIDDETQSAVREKESQLVRLETDLARIRNARDELLADQQMRKSAESQEKTLSAKVQELADAREAKIAALESETARLRLQIEGSDAEVVVEDMPLEKLRSKHANLERQYAMLSTELTSMQAAYMKFSKLASQKVLDFGALEEKISRLTAEKSKADQKYFAAMKTKETRDAEIRTLRMQSSSTSDIISQLKHSESVARSLVSNLEKQTSEAKEALTAIQDKYRMSQQQLAESTILTDGLKNQVAELKALSVSKDTTLGNTSSALRQAETEIVGLKQTLSDTKKSLENWKSKSLGNNSAEYEGLRSLAICTVCRLKFKNTVIKTCGHVFCFDCVEERLTSRSRKCPNCNKSFGSNDHMHITL